MDGGQHLFFLVRVLDGDLFCHRGRPGVITAISKGVPTFCRGQNKKLAFARKNYLGAHSIAWRECRLKATDAQQSFYQVRRFPTCIEASTALSDRFPAAQLPRCTSGAFFQSLGLLLKPLA